MKCNNPERYAREKAKEKEREETTGSKEKRKCFICKGDINVLYSGENRDKITYKCLTCSRCKKFLHFKPECSGETREGRGRVDETTWVCPTCTEEEAEKEKKGTGTEVEYVMSTNNNKGPIKVLQWNADSLLSKKEEFKLFLKKWEMDVFLIQETKMTNKE